MRHTQDQRGESYWDVFAILPGQINISRTLPGQARGFHLHKHKTDYWFVLSGTIKVVLFDETSFTEKILTKGDELVIEPGLWHAYQCVGEKPATMVYYETAKSGPTRDDDYEKPLDIYGGWE